MCTCFILKVFSKQDIIKKKSNKSIQAEFMLDGNVMNGSPESQNPWEHVNKNPTHYFFEKQTFKLILVPWFLVQSCERANLTER